MTFPARSLPALDGAEDQTRKIKSVLNIRDRMRHGTFIWDEAGFEGTTARIREKQKAGDYAGMAAQISDDHIAVFATESSWDGLADALVDRYGEIATRIVLYNGLADQERVERYGEVARRISTR